MTGKPKPYSIPQSSRTPGGHISCIGRPRLTTPRRSAMPHFPVSIPSNHASPIRSTPHVFLSNRNPSREIPAVRTRASPFSTELPTSSIPPSTQPNRRGSPFRPSAKRISSHSVSIGSLFRFSFHHPVSMTRMPVSSRKRSTENTLSFTASSPPSISIP